VAGGVPFRLGAGVFSRWDAIFYHSIAVDGYPRSLPLDASGAITGNNWAFFPAFPATAGLLMRATGLAFDRAAILLNVIAGAIATLCLGTLARRFLPDRQALGVVTLFAFFPTSFVLQVPYAEAMYLAFAAGCLVALAGARDRLAAVLLLGAALSRGVVLPLAAAAWWRVWSGWRSADTRRRRDFGVLAGVATISPMLWVAVAGLVTGQPDAYAATQRAWRYAFDPALTLTRWYQVIGDLGRDGYLTAIVLTLIAAAVLTMLSFRLMVPAYVRVYTLLSTVLLFALAQPGAVAFTSVPRFAFGIATFPLLLTLVLRRTWAVLAVTVVFVGLQYLWVLYVWSGWRGVAP